MKLQVRGVLLDLDGTVWDQGRAIPGAAETVRALREAGIPLRFLTNTSRSSREQLLGRLEGQGIEAGIDEMYTASYGAALWLEDRGIQRAAVLVPEVALSDFSAIDLDGEQPEVVLVGDLGYEWTFDRLNRAFRWLLNGAELVAIHKNRYWRTAEGMTLDAGAFVAALEFAVGREAYTVGKPSREFFETAARSMALEMDDVVMVGDDLSTDIAGAKPLGATTVLVRTGKYLNDDLAAARAWPDVIIDSIEDLPKFLSLLQ